MKLTRILNSKKAADPNQIFIYISAIVIVGFVFLYGFKAVATFVNSSQDIELAKFIKDFKTSASSVSAEFGSVTFTSIRIPSQFDKMCIVDVTNPSISFPSDCVTNTELGQEVCDAWKDYKGDVTLDSKNIFFLDAKNHIGYKDNISGLVLDYRRPNTAITTTLYHDTGVDSRGFLCTTDGKLRLEGGARQVIVSADTSS